MSNTGELGEDDDHSGMSQSGLKNVGDVLKGAVRLPACTRCHEPFNLSVIPVDYSLPFARHAFFSHSKHGYVFCACRSSLLGSWTLLRPSVNHLALQTSRSSTLFTRCVRYPASSAAPSPSPGPSSQKPSPCFSSSPRIPPMTSACPARGARCSTRRDPLDRA
jgi:hypothetical protein